MNSSIAETAHPPIASRSEWLAARKELLKEEKQLTKLYDQINAKRRRLPMVKVEADYRFVGEDGEKSLRELFDGQRQLIVYHFMFGPDWEMGCPSCTSFIDAFGKLPGLNRTDTQLVLVSRAPYAKLAAYRKEKGWTIPWYSSYGSEFNYDFNVTLDPSRGPRTYNFAPAEEWGFASNDGTADEVPGFSVFFRLGDEVYHTYSMYARAAESMALVYRLLDITPYGRQEDFEDSPAGWPQQPTYG